jgi:exopolysaccharide biosynthesis protein
MWLAEWLFPSRVIEKVMSKQETTEGVMTDPSLPLISFPPTTSKPEQTPNETKPKPTGSEETDAPPDEQPTEETPEPLPQVGDIDEFGNVVIVSDEEQEIYILQISGTGYLGRLIFVRDPSRVVVRHTSYKGSHGEFLLTYLKKHNAIAGINGNGFADENGVGNGGVIHGWSIADGVSWGQRLAQSASAGFTADNILMVGTITDPNKYEIRDMVQWGPVLIANGEQIIYGGNSAGWGVQPRTAIGQTGDGTVILATVDGRQTHSLGITAGTLSDVLFQYGCINASLCDGGSSSIMAYDEELIGLTSSPMKTTGRYLPNAILVLRKEDTVEP